MKSLQITALLIFLLAAGTSQAQDLQYMPATIELQASADHYGEWKKTVPCRSGSLNTVITLSNPQSTSDFSAKAKIDFLATGEAGSFALIAEKPRGSMTAALRRILENGDILETHNLQGNYPAGVAVPVAVYWHEATVTVSINGKQSETIKLGSPIETLRLIAVGSHAKFEQNWVHCNLLS